jgi:hypothetical protein
VTRAHLPAYAYAMQVKTFAMAGIFHWDLSIHPATVQVFSRGDAPHPPV